MREKIDEMCIVKLLEKYVPKTSMKELRKEGYTKEGGESDFNAKGSFGGDALVIDSILSCINNVLLDDDSVRPQTCIYWLR